MSFSFQKVHPNYIDGIIGEKKSGGEVKFLVSWTDLWVGEDKLDCPGLLQAFLDSSAQIKAKYKVIMKRKHWIWMLCMRFPTSRDSGSVFVVVFL